MSHTFTRQELYDLVWSEPMQKIAKRFGLSDVGLAKACRSIDVPRPGRGYWARLAAGKRVVKAARPPRGLGESDEVTIGAGGGAIYGTSDEVMASEVIAPLPEFEEAARLERKRQRQLEEARIRHLLDRATAWRQAADIRALAATVAGRAATLPDPAERAAVAH